jgi:hypothetical protein
MVERREDLSFLNEAAPDFVGVYSGSHDLDGHRFAIDVVDSFGEVHDAHASGANLIS